MSDTSRDDLLHWYSLQLREEKDRRQYYQTIVYDVCNLVDKYRHDGKKTVCGTVDEPSYDLIDSLSDIIEYVLGQGGENDD